ncbi:LppP/LprE family lipoprotein [Actinomycetaceae bacterium L2_0104]
MFTGGHKKRRRRAASVSLGAGALLVLASCAMTNGSPAPTTASSSSPSPSVSSPISPSPSESPIPSCSELTGETALTTWGPQVPPYWEDMEPDDPRNWDLENSDSSTYDPCSELSWITLHIRGGTASSPYHIMLFSHGEYIGTATPQAYGFFPTVERLSNSSLQVTYHWPKEGESNADHTGTSVSIFTLHPRTGEVARKGELPPTQDKKPTPTPSVDIEGAFPGAGGPIPADATPATAIRPAEEGYEYEVAVIVTPSGNIGCDLTAGTGSGCGVQSYAETQPHGSDELGPKWWIGLGGADVPEISSRGDAPFFVWPDVTTQTVPYGQSVYYGNYVCGSAESGLTCWNIETGHGAFMNRDGYQAF